MNRSIILLALFAPLLLSACLGRSGPPAPVANLGLGGIQNEGPEVPAAPAAEVMAPETLEPIFVQAAKTPAPNNNQAPHRMERREGQTSFAWPLRGPVISRYGQSPGSLHNDGINIAAKKGTVVLAAADGVVAYVGRNIESYGTMVMIRHDSVMMTAYAHLGGATVKQGQYVKKGQAIGTVGASGSMKSAQLHFQVRRDGKPVDPGRYLF